MTVTGKIREVEMRAAAARGRDRTGPLPGQDVRE
jgi:hypothetical protein